MTEPLKIAVAGLGTVGAATVALLHRHAELLAMRGGRPLRVVAVSARSRDKERGAPLGEARWYEDAVEMAAAPGIDVVVELIGGSEGVAKAVCEAALGQGRHVVTANKALLAHYGGGLAAMAEETGATLAYEAAVAAGVPIVRSLRDGLAANLRSSVYGILNGTCNYILSNMRETGRDFADVLAEAQTLGYAEADPTFDIDGLDAAHKLALLTSLAFGCRINFDGVHVEGIRHVSAQDIQYAEELGYRIKLLGIALQTERGVMQRVHPCLVPIKAPIAHVEGVFNAIQVEGDSVGKTVCEGSGAGAGPTSSAVVADLLDIAQGRRAPTFGVPVAKLPVVPATPMEDHVGAYYLRLTVVDRPGVMADITAALRDGRVSLQGMLQRGRAPDDAVTVVLTTHETREAAMVEALERIDGLDTVVEPPRMIRIEPM